MTLVAQPEEVLTRVDEATAGEELPIAERYTRDRAALKHPDAGERRAAVVRLVESGSSAVYPLLRVVAEDSCMEVREAAIWSLLWLTDDMLGGDRQERESPRSLLVADPKMDRYLRLGLEAVAARQEGSSPADTAAAWLGYVDPNSRNAAARFIANLVREAPNLDPKLVVVLQRVARRHLIPETRRLGARLLKDLENRPSTASMTESEWAEAKLLKRRASLAIGEENEMTPADLLAGAISDPDRAVRHRAGATLFHRVVCGARVDTPNGLTFKDRELRCLFLEGHKSLCPHPNPAKSLKRLTNDSPHARRCVLRLFAHLRPFVNACNRGEMDAVIRTAMRDSEREVRRDASKAAGAATSESIGEELAGRLRERLKYHPPIVFLILIGLIFVSLPISYIFMKVWWVRMIPQLLTFGLHVYSYGRYRTGKHGITHEEYLETLVAMEPIAQRSPEKLIASVPELRKLAGPGAVVPEVRAKARELLAKVHESTLHELPIASEPLRTDPTALPVVASADR